MKEIFLKNFKLVEKTLLESKIFDKIKTSGFNMAEMSPIYTKMMEIGVQSALSLEELELKNKANAMELEKISCDMELSTLNAKAQIKIAQAEALKGLIQGASMVRSVADNAYINKANSGVGFLNVVGNATNSSAITSYGQRVYSFIENINAAAMTAFDNKLQDMINASDNSFGSCDVIIHASKKVLVLGEFLDLKGISTFGQNECKWLINDELVAKNAKNYVFEAENLGEFKVRFCVKNDEGEFVRDEIILKVIEGESNKTKPFIKKM